MLDFINTQSKTNSRLVTNRSWVTKLRALPAALLLCANGVQAGFSQNDVTSPGGFVSVYSGLTQGANPNPGFDLSGEFNDVNINEQSFSGTSAAFSASSYSNAPHSNSGFGTAGQGFMQFSATSSTQYDFTSFHSNTWVHGGWADSITISNPALTGQTATWLFDINVSGLLSVNGFAPSSGIEIEPYVNNARLDANIAGVNLGGSDPVATTVQHAQWYETTDFVNVPSNRAVNDTVTFAADIIIGEEFDLGIFAIAIAGGRNSSSFQNVITTADTDLLNTITWGGSAGLILNGNSITEFDLSSASGVDWIEPVTAIPVPATFWLFASGLLSFIGFVRKRSIERSN